MNFLPFSCHFRFYKYISLTHIKEIINQMHPNMKSTKRKATSHQEPQLSMEKPALLREQSGSISWLWDHRSCHTFATTEDQRKHKSWRKQTGQTPTSVPLSLKKRSQMNPVHNAKMKPIVYLFMLALGLHKAVSKAQHNCSKNTKNKRKILWSGCSCFSKFFRVSPPLTNSFGLPRNFKRKQM